MTATIAPELTAEERRRARALDLLRTTLLEVILESDAPLRTADLARLVAERLGLSLTEEQAGGLAVLTRMVLDTDPLFSQSHRQWDLALRMGRAEGDRRKPVERALEDFVDLIGHPAPPTHVAVLAAAVYGRNPDYYERMLDRLAERRHPFLPLPDGTLAIRRWMLELTSDDPQDVEEDNFEDPAVLEPVREAARAVREPDPTAYARSLVRHMGAPVENRALQFVTWCAFPQTDPVELFTRLWQDPELRLERGPVWVTAEDHRRVLDTLVSLARDPDAAAELVAATVPAEEEEIGILAPTTARVSDEDLDQVYEFMLRDRDRTYTLSELLQNVLEAFPGSRNYPAVSESLRTRLREDPRFRWVGWERYRLEGSLPPDVELLPEGLAFDDREYLGEDGVEVDRDLDPREWKFALEEQIRHYLVQDVGDDDTTPPATPPDRLVTALPLHHYVAGTLYLRHADRGLFPTEPDILQATLLPSEGNRFDVWLNNRLGLLYGLKEWYEETGLPWVGARLTIERTDQPGEYRLHYEGEVEPLMNVPLERLQQLVALRGEAASEGLPLTEVVTRILRAYPEGLHFVTLFTEVNIVRRTRRARLASILSAQRYFVQNPQQPGIWSFDEKRAAKGKGKKKGGPRRPVRELYEEEEEDFIEE